MLARRETPTNSSSVFSHFPRKRCFDEFSYRSNGQPRQNPIALIDAYGSAKRQETSWKNTEEEEFNWEDMIPTPATGKPAAIAANATSSVSRVFPGLNSNTEYHPPVSPATLETRSSVNVHAPRPPIYPSKNPVRNPFESINANTTTVSHGLINRPIPVHEHGVENNGISKRNLHQLPNSPTSGQTPPFQFFPSQNPAVSQFTLPRHGPLPNARPVMPLPMPDQRIGNNSFRPLPPAGHALPQILPHPNPGPNVSSQQPTVGYSNLISSLVAQGVISLANQAPAEVTKLAN
jgi:pre-mRNA cleavage complex 2 protein Pcf11